MTSTAKKQYAHLSGSEKEIIERLFYAKYSITYIAITNYLHQYKSTISRELHRNGRLRRYDSTTADTNARTQWKQSHVKAGIPNEFVRAYIAAHLPQYWSPELIAGRLKKRLRAVYQPRNNICIYLQNSSSCVSLFTFTKFP